ncbi:MAG: ABC transporter ATP-binding protein [Clostridia bacterium]|nr:ABC transporter ATP-binding protein [Clostridia bacterium]
MLPLDKLTDRAREGFLAHGCDVESFDAVLSLDMTLDGAFGQTWLALDRIRKRLYRLCEDDGSFDDFSLALLVTPYVDNFTSSNRLLAHAHQDPMPEQGTLDEKEYENLLEDYRRLGNTVVIGYCTNACKRKLFAFVHLWNRYAEGGEVTEDDPIFEQFNAKCPKCGTVYADQQRRICEHCVKKSATMIRLLAYFKDFKLQFGTVMFCLLASAGISLLTPIISNQLFYDQVIAPPKWNEAGEQIQGRLHSVEWVYIMVAILLGMALLSLVIGIIQNRANAYMSTRVTKNMKNDLFRALQHLSLSYFNQNSTGRLINRVNYDAVKIRSFYIDGVPHFIVNMLNFIGLTIFLFSINWKLTLIVYIPVPIVVCIFKFMLPKLWRMYSKQWRRSSSLNSMLGDSLNGIRVVKAFAKEAEETNRFYQYSEKLYQANLQTNLVHLTIFPVISLLIGISSQAIWGFGGIQVMGETMTYGQFATYLGYVGMIFGPLNFFTNFTNMLTDTINSAVRMFETLDMIPEITDAPNAVELDSIKGEIVFDRVGFHYTPNRPILKDVSFTIHAGDHVGLVGHTGSGKSTIANLITRMYDVISGSISIDGHNVKDIKVDSLRRNISIVSQEIYLFHGTIADNIRYARPDASMEEVIAAARAANAHDFILRLPEGYETMIGIGRRSLSGGERQRISIARALLMKPSLLILDEATAAMDTETERLISDAIERLIEGRTTITIAHRLSTLKDCNYLMAIENGEIAESGTAEELMEKKGVYYKLYTLQNEQMKKVMAGL